MDLRFTHFNSTGCQSYLVASQTSDEAWLIDPLLAQVDSYLQLLEQQKLKLVGVIDTHTHADHLSGSARLRDATGCAYLMHELAQPKEVTDRLSAQSALKLNGTTIKILHTPGHTRDSMCLIFPDRVITGDTLFLDDGGAGRDDLPGGNPAEHWESLKHLQELPEQLMVYPGHEYRDRKPSTLAQQKLTNPFFKSRTQEEYVRFIEELKLGPAEWMKDVLKANAICTRDLHSVQIPVGVSACEVQGTLRSCAQDKDIPHISAPALKARLDTRENLVLLDVRETRELTGELGHLPGIKHIPVGSVDERISELHHLKGKEIIAICKMGGRAKTAAKILCDAGHSVTVLTGGMSSWNEHGLPVKRHL